MATLAELEVEQEVRVDLDYPGPWRAESVGIVRDRLSRGDKYTVYSKDSSDDTVFIKVWDGEAGVTHVWVPVEAVMPVVTPTPAPTGTVVEWPFGTRVRLRHDVDGWGEGIETEVLEPNRPNADMVKSPYNKVLVRRDDGEGHRSSVDPSVQAWWVEPSDLEKVSDELCVGTTARVSVNPGTSGEGMGYVDPVFAGELVTLTEERSRGRWMVTHEVQGTQIIHEDCLSVETGRANLRSTGEVVDGLMVGDLVTIKAGAHSPNGGRDLTGHVGRVVALGIDGRDAMGRPGDPAIAISPSANSMGRWSHAYVADVVKVERNGEVLEDWGKEPEPALAASQYSRDEVQALLRAEREAMRKQHEEWLNRLGADAITFAQENEMCSQAERFLKRWEIPHQDRFTPVAHEVEVTVTLRVQVNVPPATVRADPRGHEYVVRDGVNRALRTGTLIDYGHGSNNEVTRVDIGELRQVSE